MMASADVEMADASLLPEVSKLTPNELGHTLPWVEKYRPSNMDELVSHQEIVSTIQKFISENRLPHLLFYGPPGTGKTSTILACAKQLYGPKYKSMILELNASDDRGIDVVREQIKNFASTRKIFSSGFKLIILDESDAMTSAAQAALRRIIEKYTKNVRFCLICNYVSKIIPAVQSRCTSFRFAPLSEEQMRERLDYVIKQENVNITDDGRQALTKLARGDMRRVLNVLQATSMAYDVVNSTNVYLCTGHPLPEDIENILSWLLNEPYPVAYQKMNELKMLKGLALQDILREIHDLALRVDLPPKARVYLVNQLAEAEYRLSSGTSEKVQMGALLGAFVKTRDLVVAAADQ
eukprot:comp7425_c0_seq1/m.3096 comp7425_c0_seq1/g.3096  ORF comp7425_c0_seq1/g.3096 comp7425_c0_seq1/m.3096 type:complete len:352 (-) comp7425_c0_seq1:89-1144(-)